MICPWFLYVCVLFLCACVVVVSSFAFFFFLRKKVGSLLWVCAVTVMAVLACRRGSGLVAACRALAAAPACLVVVLGAAQRLAVLRPPPLVRALAPRQPAARGQR